MLASSLVVRNGGNLYHPRRERCALTRQVKSPKIAQFLTDANISLEISDKNERFFHARRARPHRPQDVAIAAEEWPTQQCRAGRSGRRQPRDLPSPHAGAVRRGLCQQRARQDRKSTRLNS